MKEYYEIKDKDLYIKFGSNIKELNFEYPIRQVLQLDMIIIVRVEPEVGSILNENVFGVSLDGRIVWQIKPINYLYFDSPYTGMGVVDDAIKLCNWDGTDVMVNPVTGEILCKRFTK